MTNTPCTRPELCGVQTHRPGTVAPCMSTSGKAGSASTGNLAGAPKLTSTTSSGVDYSELTQEEIAEVLVDHHGIYMSEAHNEGLQKDPYGWEHTRWELKIQAQNGESFDYVYAVGTHYGDQTPQPEQVVDSMIDNARYAARFETAEHYAHELGYDWTDKEERRRTERSFNECKKESAILKRVLGEEEHQKVIFADGSVV